MNTRHRWRLLLFGSVITLPFPALAATYKVGPNLETGCNSGVCDATSIQTAIDAAGSDPNITEIHVYPGTYNENLVVDAADRSELQILHAPAVSGEVVVDGGGVNPVLTITGGQGESFVVSGLTLQNGRGKNVSSKYYGGGIYLLDSSPSLEDLVVKSNTATFGGGIFMQRSSPLIRNCRIASNDVESISGAGTGAGIAIQHDSNPVIEYSTIDSNGTSGVTDSIRGGGIYMHAGAAPELIGVRIYNNRANFGGGVYLSQGASPVFTGVLITANNANASVDNVTPLGGAGVYMYDGATPLFINSTIADNVLSTGSNGVEVYNMASSARFVNSIISNDASGKSLVYGGDFTDGTYKPGMPGLQLEYTDLCNGLASCSDHFANPGDYFAGALSAATLIQNELQYTFPDYDTGGHTLSVGSLLRDDGNPADEYDDADGSRNDLGAYGGPLPLVELLNAYDDTDGDGMADTWETAFFGDLTRDGSLDQDNDGLLDLEEYEAATSPTRMDTDRDGYNDYQEVVGGYGDPLDAADHRPSSEPGRDHVAIVNNQVNLDGSLSADPDEGAVTSYSWAIESGPTGHAASLSSTTTATTSFTPDLAGVYTIRLTVQDAAASTGASSVASASDVIHVYVGNERTVTGGGAALATEIAAVGLNEYDTITVNDSLTYDPIDFSGKIIHVRGGSGQTPVISASSGSTVTFQSGEPAAATLQGFTVQNGRGTTVNSASTGGGIFIQGAAPTIKDVTVTLSEASYGGGVAILGGAPWLENVTISNNKASVSGAGVYAYGSSPTFKKVTISGNGRILVGNALLGGGMFAYGSNFTFVGNSSIDRASITNNGAQEGAGLYLSLCERVTMQFVDITSNTGTSYGGGLLITNRTNLQATDVKFTSNSLSSATGYGGAGYVSGNSVLNLNSSTVGESGNGNSAAFGAGFAMAGTAALVDNGSTFAYNTASIHGGAIFNFAAYSLGLPSSSLTSSLLANNSAGTGEGGAIYLTNGTRMTVVKSTFRSNSAATNGGAVAVRYNDRLTVRSSLFLANQANRGGAVYSFNTGRVTLENVTMVGNSATETGSAAASYYSGYVTAENSIIAHSKSVAAIYGPAAYITITYTNLFGNTAGNFTGGAAAGTGGIAVDPFFMSYNGDATAEGNDYHLSTGSACVNAGNASAALNDLNGSRNDLGAYGGPFGENIAIPTDSDSDGISDAWELQFVAGLEVMDGVSDTDGDGLTDLQEYSYNTDPSVTDSDSDGVSDGEEVSGGKSPKDATDQRPVARAGRDRAARLNAAFTLDGSRSSDPNKDTLTYAWAYVSAPGGFDTGANPLDAAVRPQFTPTVAGDYVIGLTVNDSKTNSTQDTVTVHVAATELLVGTDYMTIQEAIDNATDWTVIRVPAGTYNETLTLGTTPLTLMSDSGAKETIISGNGSSSVVTFAQSPETVVFSGFTVTGGGGVNTNGGGIFLNQSNAQIEDCIIRDNSVRYGGGIYVYYGSPTLVNNQIIHNISSLEGGGLMLYYSSNAVLMNNIIAKNQGRYGGGLYLYFSSTRVHFNTLAGNSASATGGNMYLFGSPADVRNNIIASAAAGGGAFVAFNTESVLEYNSVYGNAGYGVSGVSMSGTNLTSDPKLSSFTAGVSNHAFLDDYRLMPSSPAIGAAEPGFFSYRDPDASLPDMGAFGGPLAKISARLNVVRPSPGLGEYSSVAAAVNATLSGDAVDVYAGTYSGVINFGGRNIRVSGGLGGETILDGGAGGAVVSFANAENANAILEDFTITNGNGALVSGARYGGGIYIKNASPTLRRLVVKNSTADQGGGIYASGSSSLIENVTVDSNRAYVYGGGLALVGGAPSLYNSMIRYNTASPAEGSTYLLQQGGGMLLSGSAATISNVLIQENSSSKYGGGIMCYNSSLVLANAVLVGNSAINYGGGAAYLNGSPATIRNSVVYDNIGSGLVLNGGPHTVEYTDLYSNSVSDLRDYSGAAVLSNNLAADPLFVAYTRDGSLGTGDDFHLQEGSTLINAGNPDPLYNDAGAAVGQEVNDLGIYGGPEADQW